MAGKGRAGTHSTVTEFAEPLVQRLEKLGRVSRGVIKANARDAGRSIKILPLEGCLRITVIAKGSRQELHVYGVSVEAVAEILREKEFRGYILNLPEA